jgi:hypothetical protein
MIRNEGFDWFQLVEYTEKCFCEKYNESLDAIKAKDFVMSENDINLRRETLS